jgi:hypothetical protein
MANAHEIANEIEANATNEIDANEIANEIEEIEAKSPLSNYMSSRATKNKIVDRMEAWCGKSKISKKTFGNTVRSLHVCSPFVFLIMLFYGTHFNVIIAAIILIGVFICFIVNNGCLLTMLEQRLCGDNFTIADPFIEYCEMEMSNKNRIHVSIYIALTYFVFYSMVYYYRFYFSKPKP